MIQNGTCRLLVVTWSTTNNNCISRRHWHGTHTHRDYVRLIWINSDCMILRHGRYNNILHDLAEFGGQVRIKLSHRHRSHLWSFIHISYDDLLVSIVVIHLLGRLLQNDLTLRNSWSFLATELRGLVWSLACPIVLLTWLLNLLWLSRVCIHHNGCSCGYSRGLDVVVRVRLCAWRGIWGSCLIVDLSSIVWDHNRSTLSDYTTIETWIASSLERVLTCCLVKLLMLCLWLRLVIVLC